MALRIISDTVSGKLDIKRLFLPGIKIEDDCPKCGAIWTWDGDQSYISFPIIGGKVNLFGNCVPCGNCWDVHITLGVKISL